MKDLIRIDSNLPNDFLRIELFLSNVCNYKCRYCFPGSNTGDRPWPKLETLIDNMDHLINYYRTNLNKKTIYIHIIGGEPTLWKDFGKFVQYLKTKHQCLLSISTNGSRTLRWWNEYGHYVDKVMISCHPEYVDTKHVMQIADMLYDKGVQVVAMVLMDTKYWDRCIQIHEELNTSKKHWDITASEVIHNTVNYNPAQHEFLINHVGKSLSVGRIIKEIFKKVCSVVMKKEPIPTTCPTIYFDSGKSTKVELNWISLNKLNYFNGWECNVGVDTFFIEKNGFLQGACGENLYGLDFKFNIFDVDFKSKFAPVITPTTCTKVRCDCQPEINCTKEKKGNNRVIPLQQV